MLHRSEANCQAITCARSAAISVSRAASSPDWRQSAKETCGYASSWVRGRSDRPGYSNLSLPTLNSYRLFAFSACRHNERRLVPRITPFSPRTGRSLPNRRVFESFARRIEVHYPMNECRHGPRAAYLSAYGQHARGTFRPSRDALPQIGYRQLQLEG